jgi:hypothetical protein
MERVFRLTADLACMWEEELLPMGALVLEPRRSGGGEGGTDLVFLASVDGAKTWREFRTVVENFEDWFEPVNPPLSKFPE